MYLDGSPGSYLSPMYLLFAAAYLFEKVATPPLISFSNLISMSELFNNSNLTFVVFRAASQARPGEVKYQAGSSS